jgi:hypothetical protein
MAGRHQAHLGAFVQAFILISWVVSSVVTDPADVFSHSFFAQALNKNFKTKFEFSVPSL